MRVLITGANGQLGRDLVRVLSEQHKVYGCSREDLDVTSFEQVKEVLNSFRPDVVIHTAAYTAVDAAETYADDAFVVNAIGTRNIAVMAERLGAKVCYISTDYVFDGTSSAPYREFDETHPTTVYGKSKQAGEMFVQSLSSRYFIVRTSWVFGLHGNNFVRTMLKLATERKEIQVVNDQIGSPTYTFDLADLIAQLIRTDKYGIYHASNSGTCSWYEFAQAIFNEVGLDTCVIPCTTTDFPRPAPRPKYSVMDNLALRASGFRPLRHWREALREFVCELDAARFKETLERVTG